MAIYYSVFGKKCMNIGGDVWYSAMDANGSVNSFELRPIYNQDEGIWEASDDDSDVTYDDSDVTYDYQKGYVPEDVDPSKCLWAIGTDISEENWLIESIADDEYPIIELKRLLTISKSFEKAAAVSEALYLRKLESTLDVRSSQKSFEYDKKIIEFVSNMKKQKSNM